jgi:hypothetical protein
MAWVANRDGISTTSFDPIESEVSIVQQVLDSGS